MTTGLLNRCSSLHYTGIGHGSQGDRLRRFSANYDLVLIDGNPPDVENEASQRTRGSLR